MKKTLKIAIAGIVTFALIQLIPVEKNQGPINEPQWNSTQTAQIVRNSCYDCHSNQTQYPWYDKIAPASWIVAHHIEEGKAELNFSEPQKITPHKVEEMIEEIQEGGMPLSSYTLLHPVAKLSEAQKTQLIQGLKATFLNKENTSNTHTESH